MQKLIGIIPVGVLLRTPARAQDLNRLLDRVDLTFEHSDVTAGPYAGLHFSRGRP